MFKRKSIQAMWPLLLLTAWWPLQSQSLFDCDPSKLEWTKYERRFVFWWDPILLTAVGEHYGESGHFHYRLAQVYSESAFNPRATSDFRGWRRSGVDTVQAVLAGMGAAGLCQFIWATGSRYGAKTVDPVQAAARVHSPDLYNPFWALDAMCRYMKGIERYLLTTKNPKARRRLMIDREFQELVATASYNTGEGRLKDRLNKFGDSWEEIKMSILPEPRTYAEKIQKLAGEMKVTGRWKTITERR